MSTSLPDGEIKSLVYKGFPPDHCCCDATWRRLPGGGQAVFFLTGNATEPQPGNYVALCRSEDEGLTWSAPEAVIRNEPGGVTLSEVTVHDGLITVYLQIHHGYFDHWETATITSNDDGRTWSQPQSFEPLPRRSMIRSLYKTTWGEWVLPYQYYGVTGDWAQSPLHDGSHRSPWNGTLTAPSPNGPWTDSQQIQGAKGWAEVNVTELRDGRLVMLARSDWDGCLLRSESTDRGRTWSPYVHSDIPNPGSKFRLFRLKDERIVLIHNPNPVKGKRNPLALWVSDDDMQTWGTKRVLTDFPGLLQYPDGEVDADERYIHFAFDYNRHDVLYWRAELPR